MGERKIARRGYQLRGRVSRPLALALASSFLWTTAPSLAQEAVPVPVTGNPASTFAAIVPAIDNHFRTFQEEAHVPGMAWGVVRDGRVVHLGLSGVQDLEERRPVTQDSLFRIASMSKAFTALAILKLRDEGRLSLDDLAETHVPEMRGWQYPTSDSPRIRVRDLLHHTAGFVTDNPWGDHQQYLPEAEFTAMLESGIPFTRAPRTAFEYSNLGYALLGRIVTNVSGRPYGEYIEQEIMRPIGMNSSGFDIAVSPLERRAIGYRWENDSFTREPDMAHGAFGAMGGVQTSAADYARWVAFLLSGWPARDGPEEGPVRRSTLRELATGLNFVRVGQRVGMEGEEPCRPATAYAMGFSVAEDCDLGMTLAHSGGYPGYGSYLLLLPEHGVGLFGFSNRTYAAPIRPLTRAALEIERAGLLVERAIPVSADLQANYAAAAEIFRSGSVEGARDRLAMNFLLDRSAENWAARLVEVKAQVGACPADTPITATGALSGEFRWTCESGTIQGYLLLAPTRPPTIQELHYIPVEPGN